MNAKQLVAATALATSMLTSGSGIAVAAPLDPPPSDPSATHPTQGIPAMKCWPYGRVGPGSARGGGGVPVYPPPCPPGTPH
ncbi:hypothetical protein A5658_25560 [Mycobacterium sp. 1245111.1]|uniref:hypothetical protein n=1 Tax=Mycobacterium sp. 1245111.1 TaxID=1834073 RepID=UPI0007FBEA5F|nr:hypothetical protein [Mycobacterium sp. 1245111.1]OBK38977.1 hypothetical protein A5658_25560 [Mycobacterium sp. 1245111.1]